MQQERLCLECGGWVPTSAGKARICSDECRDARKRRTNSSLDSRFAVLQRLLDSERCTRSDWIEPLRSKNYYEQLLLNNDGKCLFCDAEVAEVSGSGHLMGRIDHTKPHTAANCLGGCVCGFCNRLVGKDQVSVEETFLFLRPALIKLREHRGLMKTTALKSSLLIRR
jgi:hypothetical protein